MTQLHPQPTACPQCHADDSIEVGGTDRLCLQCRHEWNPRDVPPPVTVDEIPAVPVSSVDPTVAEILTAPDVATVLAPRMTAAELIAEHTGNADNVAAIDLAGQFVVWPYDSDDPALVIADEGGGTVTVQRVDGTEHEWPRVELIVAPEGTSLLAAEELREGDDDSQPIVGVIASIASLCLSIGAEAVANDESRLKSDSTA